MDSEVISAAILPLQTIRRAVVSYWQKYVHLVINGLGSLSLPRNIVSKLTDCCSVASV